MIIDYEKDYFDFVTYVSLYAAITIHEAEMLYGIATLNGYSRDQIINDLLTNGGIVHLTYRKMFNKDNLE